MSEIDWSKAPEGATHFDPNDDVGLPWMRLQQGRWRAFDEEYQCWTAPMDEDDSFIRNNDGAQCIPRPSQWRGPEDGLPPVGTVALGKMPAWRKEERCKVIAHLHGSCVVVHGIGANPDSWSTLSWCDQFRPLKSDKERAIDAAVAATILKDGPRIRAALSDIYDAGLLRLPEDQS
ncbi:MAG: hypothetical protein HRT34_03490 [Alcanivorax sp.]|nr:hypothetical protein [Alcanivorax sp.]